ncbi:hypothetical protein FVER14953_20743 [Fusarium verticillioides]|nr:hypothetical protein FVER14953_20743 [Fusarium verticillioides]
MILGPLDSLSEEQHAKFEKYWYGFVILLVLIGFGIWFWFMIMPKIRGEAV